MTPAERLWMIHRIRHEADRIAEALTVELQSAGIDCVCTFNMPEVPVFGESESEV